MRVKIHHEGTNIIFMLLFILLMVNSTAYLILSYKVISYVFMAISVVLFLLVVNFFRSPRRRFKGDVKEVASGYECGMQVEKFNDIKPGDVIECFVMEQINR